MNFREIRLIRILVAVLLFLFLLLFILFLTVLPVIRQYKIQSADYYETRQSYDEVKEEHDRRAMQLHETRTAHQKTLDAFTHRWDEAALLKLAEPYFNACRFEPLENNASDGNFTVRLIRAVVTVETPKRLFRFFEDLHTMPYVVQTDFPMLMQSDGGKIKASFHLRIFAAHKPPTPADQSKR